MRRGHIYIYIYIYIYVCMYVWLRLTTDKLIVSDDRTGKTERHKPGSVFTVWTLNCDRPTLNTLVVTSVVK
jgi:hypothetical protein